ncbi:MAG TPA: DUF1326 domain-containing protein [Ktedonosporobacter sp.]|nr:DUF1326 domain-containing protein [Ktedonosporobacter sp.]
MASTQTRWQIEGDYFENCNCAIACPCLFSANRPSKPTEGFCDIALVCHINTGNYGNTPLNDLNAVMIAHVPGSFAEGNWSVALYLDERADARQRQALEAIFSSAAGGPLGNIAPLISTILGVKAVPITFKVEGKRRSIEVPNIMHVAVQPLSGIGDSTNEIWALNAHSLAPQVAMAVGDQNSSWTDYGMNWDNSGKNGLYASINWSNDGK